MNFKKFKPKKGYALVLKSLPANLIARNNFQWPESGVVNCPDWKGTKECGNGLHGWLWGEGDAGLRCGESDAKWLVVCVEESKIINLTDKVKFPSCEVLFCGELKDAVSIIHHFAPVGNKCIFGTSTSGDGGTSTSGDGGTSTSGDGGTSTSGYGGTSTSGDRGTSTSGDRGTSTSGDGGTSTSGDGGVISLPFYSPKTSMYERRIAMIDGVNFLPGVPYVLDKEGNFIQKKDQQ